MLLMSPDSIVLALSLYWPVSVLAPSLYWSHPVHTGSHPTTLGTPHPMLPAACLGADMLLAAGAMAGEAQIRAILRVRLVTPALVIAELRAM